jgi:hypothetical protein
LVPAHWLFRKLCLCRVAICLSSHCTHHTKAIAPMKTIASPHFIATRKAGG